MRGVAGMLFIFLGLVMGYLVLAGKLPNSGNLVGPTAPSKPAAASSNAGKSLSISQSGHNTGSDALSYGNGPVGLPTMAHLNDLVPSAGGMK